MHILVNGEKIELTSEEVAQIEAEWLENSIKVNKEVNNRQILDQLKEIDAKSIRALRSNDTERLAQLEAQAEVLRNNLVK